jgi:hypothetical protein
MVGISISRYSTTNNEVLTRRFISSTGTFVGNSNTIASFPGGNIMYDLEFSPSGQFLYYATYFSSVLYQAQINPLTGELVGTPVTMNNFGGLRGGGLKLAPDGFIYHIANAGVVGSSGGTVRIGRIIQPDVLATTSNFNAMYETNVISRSNTFAYNFPEFVNTPTWSVSLGLTGNGVLLPGDTANLLVSISAVGVGIQNYQWFRNGIPFATTNSPSLDVTLSGSYYVVLNLVGSCSDTSNAILIIIDPLPVELLGFEVKKQEGKALLNWETEQEINSDFFVIEHSTDAVNYREIGEIKAFGESKTIRSYAFSHEKPVFGYNYYRLRMVDQDGQFEYAQTKEVFFDSNDLISSVRVYPNPGEGKFHFDFQISNPEIIRLEVLNMAGQLVSTTTQNLNPGPTSLEINLDKLPNGMYLYRLSTSAWTNAAKLFLKK